MAAARRASSPSCRPAPTRSVKALALRIRPDHDIPWRGKSVPLPRRSLPMWSVKLSDDQREALCVMIKAQGESYDSDLRDALRALELARWDDLPDAQLPWDRVQEMASAQGIDEADVVWDLAGGMPSKAKRPQLPVRTKVPRTRV